MALGVHRLCPVLYNIESHHNPLGTKYIHNRQRGLDGMSDSVLLSKGVVQALDVKTIAQFT